MIYSSPLFARSVCITRLFYLAVANSSLSKQITLKRSTLGLHAFANNKISGYYMVTNNDNNLFDGILRELWPAAVE